MKKPIKTPRNKLYRTIISLKDPVKSTCKEAQVLAVPELVYIIANRGAANASGGRNRTFRCLSTLTLARGRQGSFAVFELLGFGLWICLRVPSVRALDSRPTKPHAPTTFEKTQRRCPRISSQREFHAKALNSSGCFQQPA